jgi:hypothetical protein
MYKTHLSVPKYYSFLLYQVLMLELKNYDLLRTKKLVVFHNATTTEQKTIKIPCTTVSYFLIPYEQ